VVSLEDYQNYALDFGGIAKALASWTTVSGRRTVFLTLAGTEGSILSPSDPVVIDLLEALKRKGNPHIPLVPASYVAAWFQVNANLVIDKHNYSAPQVEAQVWANLSRAYAFDQRQFGQNVAASEIIQTIQATPGVTAVTLTALFLTTTPKPGVPAQLCAAAPMPAATPPQGAQLLLLDPACQGNFGGGS
jgi:hypothetical protein